MISPNPITVESEVRPGVMRHDRGFIPQEEISAAAQSEYLPLGTMAYRAFWPPVIAGAVFVFTLFVLSWYLMLGCHVGVTEGGVLAFGWGAAVWTWITAAVAFFCGGLIASTLSPGREAGWLKGAVLWGLSIPLALVIYGMAAHGATSGLIPTAYGSTGAMTGNAVGSAGLNFGYLWATFITMTVSLVFAIIGSVSGRNEAREVRNAGMQ